MQGCRPCNAPLPCKYLFPFPALCPAPVGFLCRPVTVFDFGAGMFIWLVHFAGVVGRFVRSLFQKKKPPVFIYWWSFRKGVYLYRFPGLVVTYIISHFKIKSWCLLCMLYSLPVKRNNPALWLPPAGFCLLLFCFLFPCPISFFICLLYFGFLSVFRPVLCFLYQLGVIFITYNVIE